MEFSIQNIKIICGLGNTGDIYRLTRHNVGFMFVDWLVQNSKVFKENKRLNLYEASANINGYEIKCIKPNTMMNCSGEVLQKLINFYSISPENIIITHDDLDLSFGLFKVQFGKGPKKHNGVNSIINKIGTTKFWRLRIGIENRNVYTKKQQPGYEYVLSNFSIEEVNAIQNVFVKIKMYMFGKTLAN